MYIDMIETNLNEARKLNVKLLQQKKALVKALEETLTWWHSIDSHFYEKEPIFLEMIRKALKQAKE